MKKKKSATGRRVVCLGLCALLLCAAFLSLSGCSRGDEESDAPEGYVAYGDEAVDGFLFYVPIGWTTYSDGRVRRAYVSPADRSSVSAVAVTSLLSPADYFDATRAETEAAFSGFVLLEERADERDGKAVFSVRFSGETGGGSYTVCQTVFEMDGTHLAVLTCQASNDPVRGRDQSRYEQHAGDFADIAACFRVTGSPGQAAPIVFSGEASDGMKIACDKRILGCVLYVPADWEVLYADGAVCARAGDGTNVGLLRIVNREAESILDYVRGLKEEYIARWGADNVTADMTDPAPETRGEITLYRFGLSLTRDG
ncbi:MAG: hypothetical protein J6125_02560 [Clostridia bacterium]|nr:hypothetical protein [Clostridia bacterium]